MCMESGIGSPTPLGYGPRLDADETRTAGGHPDVFFEPKCALSTQENYAKNTLQVQNRCNTFKPQKQTIEHCAFLICLRYLVLSNKNHRLVGSRRFTVFLQR